MAPIEAVMGAALDARDLGAINGREGGRGNLANLDVESSGNQANGASTGSAYIAGGALSNFSGTAAVVVNSSNNAVIQVSNQIIFNLY